MKKSIILSLLFLFFLAGYVAQASVPPRQYLELRVYHAADSSQVRLLHEYLELALLPALHSHGVKNIGVFNAQGNDTVLDKRVYVLIPYTSLKDVENLRGKIEKDPQYQRSGSTYINAAHDKPTYSRYESILLRAFELMPQVAKPALTGPKSQRVYELRSYEGPTEKFYRNKVKMFNAGGEIDLFNRLGFNAVFYGEVLMGSRMPNLMYMTSFENRASREEHWKAFGNDPAWKTLSALPEYQNNVSKIDIVFLTPAEYSDL